MFTESQLKKLKPRNQRYQIACDDGLSLVIEPSGMKYWKLRYSDEKNIRKAKRLGSYPELNLNKAQKLKLKFLSELEGEQEELITFHQVATEWLEFKQQNALGDRPHRGVLQQASELLKKDLEPLLGEKELLSIKRLDLVKAIRKIESRGVKEPCRKACSYLNQIYEYAVSLGYVELNIASNLNKVLIKTKIKKNYSYLDHKEIIKFYHDIKKSKSHPIVKKALQIKTLTGVRGAELIYAKNEDFDLENGLWHIPAIRVKQFRRKVIEGHNIPDYIIPLSTQAIEIIESAMLWSDGNDYVFNSPRKPNTPIHYNTMNRSIRLMGYTKEDISAHGLRSSMSTVLNESDLFKSEWIEAQLSHTDKNIVRGSYNHADYLEQRSKMMQWWSDYLMKDKLGGY